MFRKSHPDVYVKQEIGLSGDYGMTKEDAVRNLNTSLLAGEGPDLLLLDEYYKPEANSSSLESADSGKEAEIEGEEKTIKIKNGLEAEDRVLLLRMQGGSQYIVLDKS